MTITARQLKLPAYQVFNSDGYPASQGDFDDLAIYPTYESAEAWKKYLEDEVGASGLEIVKIYVVQD